ncbi:monovalent cation:H+ antiporter, CPA1 (nhx1) [Savitreella phatthalungensis]
MGLLQLAGSLLLRRDVEAEDPDVEPTDPALEEVYQSWALLIVIVLLIGALFTSYFLQQRKIRAVHETVISIFGGMVVGLVVRLTPGHSIQNLVSFKYTYFFNILLPPIILNSGYELHQANFFRNFGTITTFAFIGTFVSAIVIGVLVYIWTSLNIESIPITFIEALQVGATLSATDPVTVLSIFTTYRVDPKLYTVIFGESLLNDAVSIVMFETLGKFKGQTMQLSQIFHAFGVFLVTLLVSLFLGIAIGLGTALLLKHSHLRRFPQIESCIILLLAYSSYFFSNGIHMSGIVSLLFCGITLKHYAYFNMSRRTQLSTKFIFQLLAQLAENFIFIYLGLSLFTEVDLVYKPMLVLVTTIAVCAGRYAAVFPLSSVINVVLRHRAARFSSSRADGELSHPYQVMLFWAGLRGAVGVALAAGLEGEFAATLKATILVVVVLTVIVFGGTIGQMLQILGIRTGVPQEEEVSDDEFDVEEGGRLASRGQLPLSARDMHLQHPDDRAALARAQRASAKDHATPERPSHVPLSRLDSSSSTGSDLPPPANHAGVPLSGGPSASGSGSASRQAHTGPPDSPSAAAGGGLLGNFKGVLSSMPDDRTQWFLDFDDRVLKPVLLDRKR